MIDNFRCLAYSLYAEIPQVEEIMAKPVSDIHDEAASPDSRKKPRLSLEMCDHTDGFSSRREELEISIKSRFGVKVTPEQKEEVSRIIETALKINGYDCFYVPLI
jgi:hypothetical protein